MRVSSTLPHDGPERRLLAAHAVDAVHGNHGVAVRLQPGEHQLKIARIVVIEDGGAHSLSRRELHPFMNRIVGEAIDDLWLIWSASDAAEWDGRVEFLPL